MKKILFLLAFLLSFSACVSLKNQVANNGYCVPPVKKEFLSWFVNRAELYQEEFYHCTGETEIIRMYVSYTNTIMYISAIKDEFGTKLSVKESATFFYDINKDKKMVKDYYIVLKNNEWEEIFNKMKLMESEIKNYKMPEEEFILSKPDLLISIEINSGGNYYYVSKNFEFKGMDITKYFEGNNENDSIKKYMAFIIGLVIDKYNSERKIEYKDPQWMNPEIMKKYDIPFTKDY